MRITSQMMMSQYKKNVGDALSSMNKAMQTAYDYRSFEVPSDDPLAAAQTFQVHWETNLNDDYQSNVSNLKSAASTAESILQNIDSILTSANSGSALQGISGTSSTTDRQAIANEILSYRDTILSEMNSKYSDSYLFGGSNSSDTPFIVSNGQLYYRGINVDTGVNSNGASETLSYAYGSDTKTMQVNFGADIGGKLNDHKLQVTVDPSATSIKSEASGDTITVTVPSGTTKGVLQSYLQGTNTGTYTAGNTFLSAMQTVDSSITSDMAEKITISGLPDNAGDELQNATASASITDKVNLDTLANESIYVDIGLGISTTGGKIDSQSAYNSAMPGISYLGYGTTTVTDDGNTTSGVPNNVYSLLTKIADTLNNTSLSGTSLTSALDPYITNLTSSQEKLETKQTQTGTSLNLLSDTASYLENMSTSLDDRDNDVEYVDATDAITNYYMQQYCYEASLKVGSQTIQQSLMDYLK